MKNVPESCWRLPHWARIAPSLRPASAIIDFTSAGIGCASDSCEASCFESPPRARLGDHGLPGAPTCGVQRVMQLVDSGSFGYGTGIAGHCGWRSRSARRRQPERLVQHRPRRERTGVISYAIEGGSGLFAGAAGSGSSVFAVTAAGSPQLFFDVRVGPRRGRRAGTFGATALVRPGPHAAWASWRCRLQVQELRTARVQRIGRKKTRAKKAAERPLFHLGRQERVSRCRAPSRAWRWSRPPIAPPAPRAGKPAPSLHRA